MAKRRLKPYLLTFCIASRFLIAVITRAYARFKIFSRFIQSRSDEISCVKTCAGDGWMDGFETNCYARTEISKFFLLLHFFFTSKNFQSELLSIQLSIITARYKFYSRIVFERHNQLFRNGF